MIRGFTRVIYTSSCSPKRDKYRFRVQGSGFSAEHLGSTVACAASPCQE